MVQLHYDMRSIEVLLDTTCRELGQEYCEVIQELFYDYMGDPRVSSLATIKVGLDKAKNFLRWLKERQIRPSEIDEKTLKRFLIELKIKRKPNTIFSYIKALKRLLRLLGKNQLADKLKYPKTPGKIPHLPPPALVEKIIGQLREPYNIITALVYETGARVSEILSLKYKHIKEVQEGFYKIIIEEPKNQESRVVYVIRYAALLRQYLNTHPGHPEDYLFPSPNYQDKPLSPRNIEAALRRISRKYHTRIYPHLLRHLRATQLIKQHVPERIVMKLLGHKTEKMMKIYVNIVDKDVEQELRKLYGLPTSNQETTNTTKCPRCGAENQEQANYCWRCGLPLNIAAAQQLDRQQQEIQQTIQQLLQILKQNPQIIKQLKNSQT